MKGSSLIISDNMVWGACRFGVWCSVIKDVLLDMQNGRLSHYQAVDVVSLLPPLRPASPGSRSLQRDRQRGESSSDPRRHERHGDWRATIEDAKQRLRKCLWQNSAENTAAGGTKPQDWITRKVVGRAAKEEERLLLAGLELELAAAETRQAHGLDRHSTPIWCRRGRMHAASPMAHQLEAAAARAAESEGGVGHRLARVGAPALLLVRDGTQLCARGARVCLRRDLCKLIDPRSREYLARYAQVRVDEG